VTDSHCSDRLVLITARGSRTTLSEEALSEQEDAAVRVLRRDVLNILAAALTQENSDVGAAKLRFCPPDVVVAGVKSVSLASRLLDTFRSNAVMHPRGKDSAATFDAGAERALSAYEMLTGASH
jgi:hypothetical protein